MTDEPSRAPDDHATDPWCRLRLKGLRQLETTHGVAWSARIVHDGEPAGWVEDTGEGGPLTVRWADPTAQVAAGAAAERLAGRTGAVVGDPVEDLLEKLAAVHDLARHRVVLWRVPDQDGAFWEHFRYRSFPAGTTWAEAVQYLQNPGRVHWHAEVWRQDISWWQPVSDVVLD